MYRLPPIISPNMEFDLPTRMYKLPVIQQIEPQTIENGYPEEISNVSWKICEKLIIPCLTKTNPKKVKYKDTCANFWYLESIYDEIRWWGISCDKLLNFLKIRALGQTMRFWFLQQSVLLKVPIIQSSDMNLLLFL